jgi:hypothetical protein
MTPEREAKDIKRILHKFSLAQIADEISAFEQDGFWCTIGGDLVFWIREGRGDGETSVDDEVTHAKIMKFVASRPERQFATREQAVAFAKSWSPIRNVGHRRT